MSDHLKTMLTVDEALDLILAAFQQLRTETIPLSDGLGRVLAQDIRAANDLPPFANSSMDGYAVRAADLANLPITLPVVDDIPAGSAPRITVEPGQAARIMTGAPMPAGADAVVPVEQTNDNSRLAATAPTQITILKGVLLGDYVRPIGEDVRAGQVVLHAGRILRAADLGVLAGLGIPAIEVIYQPSVAVLSTGDELLEAGDSLEVGKIRDMNGYTIPALVESLGAKAVRLGIARDTREDVRAHFQAAINAKVDLIISSAGVSVGAFDVVKTVIDEMGALNFWKINMRPGKPLAFGHIAGIPFIGLPGNPVSAMVTFDVFARPAILKMAGKPTDTDLVQAEAGEVMRSDGRQSYVRVKLKRDSGKLVAFTTGNQSSGVLTSLVEADGLLIIPAGTIEIPIGASLPVRLFNSNS